jgi:hypothetical protein
VVSFDVYKGHLIARDKSTYNQVEMWTKDCRRYLGIDGINRELAAYKSLKSRHKLHPRQFLAIDTTVLSDFYIDVTLPASRPTIRTHQLRSSMLLSCSAKAFLPENATQQSGQTIFVVDLMILVSLFGGHATKICFVLLLASAKSLYIPYPSSKPPLTSPLSLTRLSVSS